MIPPVHLPESANSKRSLITGRAFRLNEPDMPVKSHGPTVQVVADQIAIVRYLDVEKSPRYQPTPTETFCNIYATDYCYLNGVYLPRVWWNPAALKSIALGLVPSVKYGETVNELNANALHDWLVAYGLDFGWREVASPEKLQEAANQGHVGVICAAQSVRKRPGHISVVVPEAGAPVAATHAADGSVSIPLQSQAGAENFCFSCSEGPWWKASQFGGYGFWVNSVVA